MPVTRAWSHYNKPGMVVAFEYIDYPEFPCRRLHRSETPQPLLKFIHPRIVPSYWFSSTPKRLAPFQILRAEVANLKRFLSVCNF